MPVSGIFILNMNESLTVKLKQMIVNAHVILGADIILMNDFDGLEMEINNILLDNIKNIPVEQTILMNSSVNVIKLLCPE